MNVWLETIKPTLLLVEDDTLLAETLARALGTRGYSVEICGTACDSLASIAHRAPRFAVVDLRLPDGSGLTVVRALHEADAAITVLVLTGYANIATAIEAIKLGATNYLCKPLDGEAVAAGLQGSRASPTLFPNAPASIPRLEWEHIMRVRAEHLNNISATARALGMHRRTLQRKLSKHPELGDTGDAGA
jgi:two-component system response regulator RegA